MPVRINSFPVLRFVDLPDAEAPASPVRVEEPATCGPEPGPTQPLASSGPTDGTVSAVQGRAPSTAVPRALDAQQAIVGVVTRLFSQQMAQDLVKAVRNRGGATQINQPVTSDIRVPTAVRDAMAAMVLDPSSPVQLDEQGCPILSDPHSAPRVLLELAKAMPRERDGEVANCALMVDRTNQRIFFGAQHGSAVDAASAVLALSGSNPREATQDGPPPFLHPKAQLWLLDDRSPPPPSQLLNGVQWVKFTS